MTVLFVEHPDGGGPGVFGEVAEMRRWRAWSEEPPAGSFDAVVVYGGSHDVVDAPPWLEREIGWLRERVDGRPGAR